MEAKNTVIDSKNIKITTWDGEKTFKIHWLIAQKLSGVIKNVVGGLTDLLASGAISDIRSRMTENDDKPENEKKKPEELFSDILENTDVDIGFIGEALKSLFSSMTPEDALYWTKYIVCGVEIDGKMVDDDNFKIVFQSGFTIFLYRVLWFVLGANYPDFFGGLGNRLSEVRKEIGLEMPPQ